MKNGYAVNSTPHQLIFLSPETETALYPPTCNAHPSPPCWHLSASHISWIELRAPKESVLKHQRNSAARSSSLDQSLTGQRRVVTPDNHILSPAGKQVELPGMRPQAVALSPNGKVLVAAGKIAGIVPINPVTGEVGKRIDLPGASEPAPDPVSPNILKPDRSGQLSFHGALLFA